MLSPHTLYHAYIVEGDKESSLSFIEAFFLEHFGMTFASNPNVYRRDFDVLSIDDSREIKEIHTTKNFGGGKKLFIISARAVAHEAQNALLKILEEPSENTHFFILTHGGGLLPTLRSRTQVVTFVSKVDGDSDTSALASTFAKSSPSERLVLVKPLIEEKRVEEATRLVKDLYALYKKTGGESLLKETLPHFEKALSYLSDRSSSLKLILEHLSLILPKI